MEAFARQAVADGFSHYGFTPHSPIPIESTCNMTMQSVERYLAEAERIRNTYAGRCRFYIGMEIDYLDGVWGPASTYFATLPLEYAIGSVHFIRSQEGEWVDIDGRFDAFARKMKLYFHSDIRYVVETFYADSHRMLDAGGFDIIGHYDKIGLNASYYQPGIESLPWYKALADDLTDHIVAVFEHPAGRQRPLTVEINTKAYAEHQRFFPAPRHISALRASGVPLIVNSDAHVPALINASRNLALDMVLND